MSAVPARHLTEVRGLLAGAVDRIPLLAAVGGLCWALGAALSWSAGLVLALMWLPVAVLALVFAARRKAAEGAAPKEDPLLAALAADAVILRFEPGGEVGDVSEAARAVLKLAPELLLASAFFERLHVADRVDFLCAMADMRHGAERRRLTLRLRLPGAGRDAFASFRFELLRGADARWPIVGLLRTDEEAQRVAAERDAAVSELRDMREHQAKLIAALGHELRTPLNAVIGFSEMLETERLGGCTDPRQREYAALIRGSGAHLLRVADAMLEAGQLEIGGRLPEPEPLDLGETAALCRSMLALQAAERGVRLVSRVGGGEPVPADRRIVQQVLVNLLANAVKFTPAGGLVTIEAERTSRDFRFRVSDTGTGMDDAALGRAGAAFARFDGERTDGSGIGLNLVHRLMALHGGGLVLESSRGAGTVATATFPLAAPVMAAPEGRPAPVATFDRERSRHGATRKTA